MKKFKWLESNPFNRRYVRKMRKAHNRRPVLTVYSTSFPTSIEVFSSGFSLIEGNKSIVKGTVVYGEEPILRLSPGDSYFEMFYQEFNNEKFHSNENTLDLIKKASL